MKLRGGGILFFAVLLVSTPIVAAARQEAPDRSVLTITVPQPVSDFIDNLSKINLGNIPLVNDISRIANKAHFGGGTDIARSINLGSDLAGIWNSLNAWFGQHVGISLGSIVSAIGDAILWILDLMSRLIRAGLSYLPGS